MLGTYVDTQTYIILELSVIEVGGITGAAQGASTGLAIEKNSPYIVNRHYSHNITREPTICCV